MVPVFTPVPTMGIITTGALHAIMGGTIIIIIIITTTKYISSVYLTLLLNIIKIS